MSQTLATSRFSVPQIATPFLGDHGALVLKHNGAWYVWTGIEWHPAKTGMNQQQFWKLTKTRPPSNVENGMAGIMPVNNSQYAFNWDSRDIRAAFKVFLDREGIRVPDGNCLDPLKKGAMLARIAIQKRVEREGLIFPAAADIQAPVRSPRRAVLRGSRV